MGNYGAEVKVSGLTAEVDFWLDDGGYCLQVTSSNGACQVVAEGGESMLPPFFEVVSQKGIRCELRHQGQAWSPKVVADQHQACDYDGIKCVPCAYDPVMKTCPLPALSQDATSPKPLLVAAALPSASAQPFALVAVAGHRTLQGCTCSGPCGTGIQSYEWCWTVNSCGTKSWRGSWDKCNSNEGGSAPVFDGNKFHCFYDYNAIPHQWRSTGCYLQDCSYPTREACVTAEMAKPLFPPHVMSLVNDSPFYMTVTGGTTYRSTACVGVKNCAGITYYNRPNGHYTDALSPPVGTVIAPGDKVPFALFSTLPLQLHKGGTPAGTAKIVVQSTGKLDRPVDINKLLVLKQDDDGTVYPTQNVANWRYGISVRAAADVPTGSFEKSCGKSHTPVNTPDCTYTMDTLTCKCVGEVKDGYTQYPETTLHNWRDCSDIANIHGKLTCTRS